MKKLIDIITKFKKKYSELDCNIYVCVSTRERRSKEGTIVQHVVNISANDDENIFPHCLIIPTKVW